MASISCIKLPAELEHQRKGLINIQNTDNNECFKWCFVRYLNPADHHPARLRKADKDFGQTIAVVKHTLLLRLRICGRKMRNRKQQS